jgi:hypothetical protein
MKKVLLIASVIALSVLIYSACSKSTEVISSSLKFDQIDNIGVIHNQALDYLSNNVDVNTASKEVYFNAIKNYLLTIAADSDKDEIAKMDLNTCNCDKKYGSIEAWVKENKPNFIEEKYLLRYSKVLEITDNVNTFWNEVKKIELDIINESDMALNKSKLLGFSSILRHSSMYWQNVYEDENHPFHLKMMNHSMNKSGWPIIDTYALIDALAYYDCLEHGQFGSYDTATSTCLGQATYSSARAFN